MRLRLTRRNLDFALHNPRFALGLVTGRLDHEEMLRERVSKDLEFLRRRASTIHANQEFTDLSQYEIEDQLRSVTPAYVENSWRMLNRWHAFLYTVTRAVMPRIVIETGVLYGHSSASILAGLEDNRKGSLISIDLPLEQHQSITEDGKHVQVGIRSPNLAVGCAVPISLRSRWNLQVGNSLELLPKILQETGSISIFIHDSLHTYDHMMAEFRLGYDALEPGGLLISDDVGYNSAWQDFCRSKNREWMSMSKGRQTSDRFSFMIKGCPSASLNGSQRLGS